MLYNAQRQQVHDWQKGDVSTCPDCQRSLFARRGELVIWHWAHYPAGAERAGVCGHKESAWHLTWKAVYDTFPGWTVEARVKGFRADAANLKTRSLREFIHCLSAHYMAKHQIFAALDYDVRWIFDGSAFESKRKRGVAKGGIHRLLTPRAYQLHVELGRRCWVHWGGNLWKEWEDKDVWYQRTDDTALKLVLEFDRVAKSLRKESQTQEETERTFNDPDFKRHLEALK